VPIPRIERRNAPGTSLGLGFSMLLRLVTDVGKALPRPRCGQADETSGVRRTSVPTPCPDVCCTSRPSGTCHPRARSSPPLSLRPNRSSRPSPRRRPPRRRRSVPRWPVVRGRGRTQLGASRQGKVVTAANVSRADTPFMMMSSVDNRAVGWVVCQRGPAGTAKRWWRRGEAQYGVLPEPVKCLPANVMR